MIAIMRSLENLDMELMGKTALLMFFAIFVLVVVYAWTRSRQEMAAWSRIPLTNDDETLRKKEPRS